MPCRPLLLILGFLSLVGGDGPKHKTTTERNDKLSDLVSQRVHKTPIPGVGAAQLLDLPLGVKLPMIPGTDTVYFTTNISEKVRQLFLITLLILRPNAVVSLLLENNTAESIRRLCTRKHSRVD